MSDRTSERSAFLSSLKEGNSSPDWEEFLVQIEGQRTAECIRQADLIRVACGEADEATRRRVREHAAACTGCGTWLAAYERGRNSQSAESKGVDQPDTLAAEVSKGLKRSC